MFTRKQPTKTATANRYRARTCAVLVFGALSVFVTSNLPAGATGVTDGSLDASFSPAGFNGSVRALAVQSDGKIIAGGEFGFYDSTGANVSVKKIARLNTDGTLDSTFSGAGFSGTVNAIAIDSDGKIIVGGSFSAYDPSGANVSVGKIVRLNEDGSLDTSFNNGGAGFNDQVNALAIQTNGKILVGGVFMSYNSDSTVQFVARLNANGSNDSEFAFPEDQFDYLSSEARDIKSLAIQSDGKIVIGGDFARGASKRGIARLEINGALDGTFQVREGFTAEVRALAIQSDGKIIAGSDSTQYNSAAAGSVTRLKTDGTLDDEFATVVNGLDVRALIVQSDGKIVFASDSLAASNKSVNRLNINGSFDLGFNHDGFNATALSLALMSDGTIIVGGNFATNGTTPRRRIARLGQPGPAVTTTTAPAVTTTTVAQTTTTTVAPSTTTTTVVAVTTTVGTMTTFAGFEKVAIAKLPTTGNNSKSLALTSLLIAAGFGLMAVARRKFPTD